MAPLNDGEYVYPDQGDTKLAVVLQPGPEHNPVLSAGRLFLSM